MKKLLLACLFALSTGIAASAQPVRPVYEVRIYGIEMPGMAADFDRYAATCLVPAFERQGVRVGAWNEGAYRPESNARFVVLIYKDIDHFQQARAGLWQDRRFVESDSAFFKERGGQAVYAKYDAYLCEAFDNPSHGVVPDSPKGFYEMRIYNSPTDEALERKVEMFNNGEMDIFAAAGVNCLFFGKALAGPEQPVLIYMTWYDSLREREANWEKFRTSEAWQRMKADSYYEGATSTTRYHYLSPTAYTRF